MSDELKPCPFCGSPAEWWSEASDSEVFCPKCDAAGGRHGTREENAKRWNRLARALEAERRERALLDPVQDDRNTEW
jgi:Lar family restriction alleviation protein